MIGQEVVNAALEGMNLILESFSRKGRKMLSLTIKTSDKNLIKVASLNGERQHWCSYWIVPAIPNSGTFPVPAGFRFSTNLANCFFVENEAGDHKIQLFEGDYLILVAPSIRELIAETSEGEARIWLSKGIFVANAKYFKQHWEPAETNEKTIRELIARGTLVDSENSYQGMLGLHSALESSTAIRSREEHINRMEKAFKSAQEGDLSTLEYKAFHEGLDYFRQAVPVDAVTPVRDEKLSPHWYAIEESVFDSESSAQNHPGFKDFDYIVINQKNPSNRQLHMMKLLLRDKGYMIAEAGEVIPFKGDVRKEIPQKLTHAIIDLNNPSEEHLQLMRNLLRARNHFVFVRGVNTSLEEIAFMEEELRKQGRIVVDTLNPSKPMLNGLAALLMSRSYLVYRKGDEGLSDLAWVKSLLRAEGYRVITDAAHVAAQDSAYESGYHKGMVEMRRIYDVDKRFALRAYEVGFEAGRMVERLGILNGEEKNDREERESIAEGNTRVGGTFPFVGTVTGRFGSRHTEKLARHAANFRDGIASFRESESRPHQTTQWANSEQPCYPGEGESCGDEVHSSDGEATPERNENEKDNAQATDSQS